MLYKTCQELPLAIFIKIVTTDNVKLLVVSGEYTEQQIADAWSAIYSEYFELCGSGDSKHMINTAKSAAIAENKILMINAAVSVLRLGHSDTMYDVLSRLGFKAKRVDDPEERSKELDGVISRAKSLVYIVNDAERQIKEMEGGKKATLQDYTNTIVSLGKYQGYRIDPETTSVAEYLAIQKNYRLELEYHSIKK